MKSIFLTLIWSSCGILLQAQSVDNINASFDGEKVTVSYVLNHPEVNQKFTVTLYSSHDNYSQPLSVTGDAGENVLPGRTKRVVWDARGALPSQFDADIRIKIKATKITAPKLVFEPLALKTYKKGRTVAMSWTGGYPTDKVSIELYQNNKIALLVADKIDNSLSYQWKMPKSVKGKKYTLRLTNTSQAGAQAESTAFNIKPRTPFIVKILPVIAVAGVLLILNNPEPLPPTPQDDVLPRPVTPGG
jgi:hypothetical protein